ncbi:hypothetical protein B0I35DRAFT_477517 [Stachybotrys elegans]|uniref:Uncharacterized protein n=1 Tax=Stachybotrys elegans TaxID=80388 RepID=A0A8K0SY79_9HYPO|nr:hypothetical protein B0I35DRAFT_477517 [Stachybotrys elegans]
MASAQVMEHVAETMDFLNDASHLMRMVAPHTSAHLMRVRNDFSWHNGISPTDVQRQHACGGCGHIMIPGDTNGTSMILQGRPRIRNKKRRPTEKQPQTITTPSAGPTKVISCGLCGRQTTVSFGPPTAATRRKTETPREKQKKQAETKEAPKATANASSKKRAKNRKAGGLQALLAGQQQQRSGALSLADFMTK